MQHRRRVLQLAREPDDGGLAVRADLPRPVAEPGQSVPGEQRGDLRPELLELTQILGIATGKRVGDDDRRHDLQGRTIEIVPGLAMRLLPLHDHLTHLHARPPPRGAQGNERAAGP